MNESRNSVYHWWIQRTSAVILLLLFPWFAYLFSHSIYADKQLSFNSKLFYAINHPLELLFFIILLFHVFQHAVLGMQTICEDYIHNIPIRIFTITCIRYLSNITYITLTFTILFSYKHLFFIKT
ncbi:MAG: succinate dehydrogenase, hydrophobic membrane anchor protein [Wolbachia endosymbiont of Menacanthus eurysternus]|nr:MAG: succinate dehydrogenase, hydrophobic membrane anchor protein [Wolbachia endosymbiont of Menacanthus eurysternus]